MNYKSLILASALASVLAVPAFAGEVESGNNYARLSAGAIIPEDINGTAGATAVKLRFDTGWTVSGAVGTWLDDNVAIEGELGYLSSDFKDGTAAGVTVAIDGKFESTLLMANLNYHFAGKKAAFDPYVGVGAGAAFSKIDINSVGGVPINQSDTSTDAAAQATAGLNYNVDSGVSLGVQYRYLYTDTGGNGSDAFTAHNLTANVTFAF